MSQRRNRSNPGLKLNIWKNDGGLWFADVAALLNAIAEHSIPEAEVKRRMGDGYFHLGEALDGKGLCKWSAAHVEYGILKKIGNNDQPSTLFQSPTTEAK